MKKGADKTCKVFINDFCTVQKSSTVENIECVNFVNDFEIQTN